MLEFLSLNLEVFGLDISDSAVRIIKLKKKRGFFSLASWNEIKLSRGLVQEGLIKNEAVMAKIIRSACENVKGEKLKTKYAAVSLPEEKSFLQVIQMPQMQEEELRGALSFEIENYIPLPASQVYFDFKVIGNAQEKSGHLDVLVIAMPKAVVDSYVLCLKKAGIAPFAMEVESQAIIRAVLNNKTSAQPVVLLNIAEDKTNFIVFSANSMRFTSSIAVSYSKLSGPRKTLVDASSPALKEFILQINKYIYFYKEHASHEHSAKNSAGIKIMLSGAGSEIKGLSRFLSEELDMPVEIGDFWLKNYLDASNAAGYPIFRKNSSSFVTAVGLALRDINYK